MFWFRRKHTTETIQLFLETHSREEVFKHLKQTLTPKLFKHNPKEFDTWASLFLKRIVVPYLPKDSADAIITLLRVSRFKSHSVMIVANEFVKPSYLLANTQLTEMSNKVQLLNLISASCLIAEFREMPDSSLWLNYTFVEVLPHIPRMVEELHVCSHLLIYYIQEMISTIAHQLEIMDLMELSDLSEEQMLQASYVLSLRDVKFKSDFGNTLDPTILDRIKLVATKVFNPDTLDLLLSLGPLNTYEKWCMLSTKYLNIKSEDIPFEV